MINVIDNLLLFIAYIFTPFMLLFFIYNFVTKKKISWILLLILGSSIAYSTFYYVESKPKNITYDNSVKIYEVSTLNDNQIVEVILKKQLDNYKNENLFTKNKLLDYKIERINGPIKIQSDNQVYDDYFDISYSVKTINSNWVAGNGDHNGLWIYNKNAYYRLLKEDDKYILKHIGRL